MQLCHRVIETISKTATSLYKLMEVAFPALKKNHPISPAAALTLHLWPTFTVSGWSGSAGWYRVTFVGRALWRQALQRYGVRQTLRSRVRWHKYHEFSSESSPPVVRLCVCETHMVFILCFMDVTEKACVCVCRSNSMHTWAAKAAAWGIQRRH